MKLGEKIKLLRNEKNLTQPELAEKAGIEQSYLSKLENEKGSPTYEIINRIAMALDMTAMDIINSLNQSYIENNLSHIPEVVAEYSSIKFKREAIAQKRYLIASLCTAIGLGLWLFAYYSHWINITVYTYFSPGIISKETSFQRPEPRFKRFTEQGEVERVDEVNENSKFLLSYEYFGEEFIDSTEEGDRYYYISGQMGVAKTKMGVYFILIVGFFGVVLLVSGLFGLLFSVLYFLRSKST